ncbi:MAG: transposase [Planctomycetes bacterium]|nr:transposase [Planctomycetota bacterium]
MGPELLGTFVVALDAFRPLLTQPSHAHLVTLVAGWVLTNGRHAVTEALVATDVARRRHHEAYHRFFSRGTWNPDGFGLVIFDWLTRRLGPGAAIPTVLDDTLAAKKGPHVFGIGCHIDAVRSTRRQRIFAFGHCWVVLALVVPVPFSTRTWALPVLFRLYRTKKECAAKGARYRKKTELARELIDILVRWAGQRRVEVVADCAYCNDTVTRGLPARVVLFGAMRPDAVLTALPAPKPEGKAGRPRKRGAVLPKPQELARDTRHRWKTRQAYLYGESHPIRFKECCAQWYRACGTGLLRIVVVHVARGHIGLRVFFSTDSTLSAMQILEHYALRWSIEVCFRNLKQQLGFAHSSARKQKAVERTAPFVGITYSILVLWFLDHVFALGSDQVALPVRPWYRQKRGLSFADVLRTAQRVLAPLDVLDPGRSVANLHQSPAVPSSPSRGRIKRAA